MRGAARLWVVLFCHNDFSLLPSVSFLPSFRRKILHLAGPTLARRRITLELLNEIDLQIQRSVMIIVATNVLIALATWALFAIVGIHRAAFWGLLAGLLHIVPYVGTGLEDKVARDSGAVVIAKRPGVVSRASRSQMTSNPPIGPKRCLPNTIASQRKNWSHSRSA